MQLYNDISSAIFDALYAPFGHEYPAFDLLLWPALMGVVALVAFKYVSNQSAIARVKKQISMHLIEIRLFSHDIAQVLKSSFLIVGKNSIYVGHNLLPMIVMLPPMGALMVQLVTNYGYAPSPVGSVELLHLQLDPAETQLAADVSLKLPAGVSLDAPMVRTADGQVYWRVRADQPGDHVFQITVGGKVFEKGWAVGGAPRKVPVKRLRSAEALLYPGEPAIGSGEPVVSIELETKSRPLAFFPDGEGGILLWSVGVSILAALALKPVFGVTF
jgi:hypothetical protein